MNRLGSEKVAVGGTIDPDATGASTVVSDYMSMADFQQALAVIMTGTLGASATVDAKLVQATDAAGTGSKDITGKAITQLVKASNDDDQATIDCLAEELDVANGFDHVAISLTVGAATSDVGAVLLGLNPRYLPATDSQLSSVVENVN